MFQFLALSNPVTLGIAAVATIGFFLYKSNKDKEEQIEASKEELERKMAYYSLLKSDFAMRKVAILKNIKKAIKSGIKQKIANLQKLPELYSTLPYEKQEKLNSKIYNQIYFLNSCKKSIKSSKSISMVLFHCSVSKVGSLCYYLARKIA
nr:hypothetical protein [uncultured Campylobacter sp.]